MALEKKNPRDLEAHLSRNLLPAPCNLPPQSSAWRLSQHLKTQFIKSRSFTRIFQCRFELNPQRLAHGF